MKDQTSKDAGKHIPPQYYLANCPPFPRLPDGREVIKEGLRQNEQETILVNASVTSVPLFDPVVIYI